VKNICQIEAAQFEINGRYRIIERKPDSSRVQKGMATNFRAQERDVLEMIKRLEGMIMNIAHAIP